LEEREIAEQRAREAVQTKAKLAQEVTLAARQRAELEERESAQLRAQAEQSHAEVASLQATARQRRNRRIVQLAKSAGLVSAMAAVIGFSLPALYTQKTAPVQPGSVPSTEASQPIRPVVAQAGENVNATQPEPATGQVKPETHLAWGGLKMSDQLGQKELAE